MRDLIPVEQDDYTIKYGIIDPNSAKPTPFMDAPWRSLIYRNTQTPFTYGEALTLYPHMPFDSAGHDCRAGQWLGEWMVSIPAVRKHPEIFEDRTNPAYQDPEPQPYAEVRPGEDGYNQALKAAKIAPRYATRKSALRAVPGQLRHPLRRLDARHSDNTTVTPRDTNNDGVPDHANCGSHRSH